MDRYFQGFPAFSSVFLMVGNSLLHFFIRGDTGCNKDFLVFGKFISKFKGMPAFSAPAPAENKYDFVQNFAPIPKKTRDCLP
jgi:hypothetical protein